MFKRDVLLAIHNFSLLKSLANNTKISSSLKLILIQQSYMPNAVRPNMLKISRDSLMNQETAVMNRRSAVPPSKDGRDFTMQQKVHTYRPKS